MMRALRFVLILTCALAISIVVRRSSCERGQRLTLWSAIKCVSQVAKRGHRRDQRRL
jgi:hypothetical protein